LQEIQDTSAALSAPANRRSLAKDLLYTVIVMTLSLAIPFASGFVVHRFLEHGFATPTQPLDPFWDVWNLLDENFYGHLPSAQERTYGAIRGALETLGDSYTIFLEPQSGEVERDRLAGVYGGVGVDIWREGDGGVNLFPYADSPAETAGVQSGDSLLAVDEAPVAPLTTDEILVLLRGDVGSDVTLMISRPPTPTFDVVVTREEIRIPSVTYRLLDDAIPQIGYIHITRFTERTSEEATEAISALISDGATSLILDLRDNGGGLITPAVDVADLLLDGGTILFEETRDDERTFSATQGGIAADIPLVVLVNRSTASAAEIVAGAIQARERGILIGTQTYGKGSVQLIYQLSNGSSVHVTSAVWLLPNRQPVGPNGLLPDIAIEWSDEIEDPQLRRAIDYFQTGE
jgi:carboxyl-terminal processing protease